jgi:hypothetical protein
MEKTSIALVAALGTVVAASPVQASAPTGPDTVLSVTSIAELLNPIPNALEKLRIVQAQDQAASDEIQVAETLIIKHHHHHHHHHYRPHHHHHHHYKKM